MKQKFEIDKKIMNLAQTLECGQIFSYQQNGAEFLIFSANHFARVTEKKDVYQVECTDKAYFENFFDLKIDYEQIKARLRVDKNLEKAVEFGSGIRILRQDKLETIISFVISANNNIARIRNSIRLLRENYGEQQSEFFAFPTLEKLTSLSEQEFLKLGVGYRAKQLVRLVQQLKDVDFEQLESMQTQDLRKFLMQFSGVGPKVADCILLFAFSRLDVFPVDTWIEKVYNKYFGSLKNRNTISNELVLRYGNLSGYAQQYLFFYARSLKINKPLENK